MAVLEELGTPLGVPRRIAIANGLDFMSKALNALAYRHQVQLEFSRPGKPTDNAYVESFNGHFRDECLNQHWFTELPEARAVIERWRVEYIQERPHRALQQQTPAAFWVNGRSLAEAPG